MTSLDRLRIASDTLKYVASQADDLDGLIQVSEFERGDASTLANHLAKLCEIVRQSCAATKLAIDAVVGDDQ